MVSPKFFPTHGYYGLDHFRSAPHVVNLFVDYNCVFSAKLFLKFTETVIPQVEKAYPGKFQFEYYNVVQPWHPNSVYLNEFSLAVAKVLREKGADKPNEVFWNVSGAIYRNKEQFFDNANVDLTRNEVYRQIYDVVSREVSLPFSRDDVLENLTVPAAQDPSQYKNSGNKVSVDLKYFTRYQRTVGVHITPTVSVDGIANAAIESSTEPDELVKIFGSLL